MNRNKLRSQNIQYIWSEGFFFFNDTATTEIYTLSLHDALPILQGPIPLPTEIKKYTVNRAAFVYKNAREQFEMRIHKRLIDILNPTPKIIESLTNLSLPSGVNIDVKLIWNQLKSRK